MPDKRYKDKQYSAKDLSFFATTGFSMWPFLKPGEKLVIKKVPIETLKIGDIILYRDGVNNQLVCHRLIKKVEQRQRQLLYARGDNAISSPQIVNEGMLQGKAIGIIKNKKIINLEKGKHSFINRIIVIIAPFVSRGNRIIKPWYNKFRAIKRTKSQ